MPWNSITSNGASELFQTLSECRAIISTLDLCGNEIDDDSMVSLADYLRNNQYLQFIDISRCNLSDEGVEALKDMLIGNSTLEVIDLSGNDKITEKSVPYLIEIANKSAVSTINLEDITMKYEGLKEIKNALKIPIEKRDVPIVSNSKSAAKVS